MRNKTAIKVQMHQLNNILFVADAVCALLLRTYMIRKRKLCAFVGILVDRNDRRTMPSKYAGTCTK